MTGRMRRQLAAALVCPLLAAAVVAQQPVQPAAPPPPPTFIVREPVIGGGTIGGIPAPNVYDPSAPVRTGTSRISGRITGMNGQPLRQAVVRLTGAGIGAGKSAIT